MSKIINQLIGPPAEHLPFSSVVGFGNLVFFSGKIGLEKDSSEEEKRSIESQTKSVMEKIKSDLEKLDLSMDNVIKVTIFVTDMKAFGSVNHIYKEYFSNPMPARSCVEVCALPNPDAMIEIELIAGRIA